MADDETGRRQPALQRPDGAALGAWRTPALAVRVESAPPSMGGNDGVAFGYAVRKVNADVLSARTDDSGPEIQGAMDLERVRVKLEVARARMSGPFSEIPTGREYDSPPDAADELAYDALEKAYNSAFSVPTPARATTSPRTHDADLPFRHDAQPRVIPEVSAAVLNPALEDTRADISMGKTETMTKVVLPGLREELAVWKGTHGSDGAKQVGTLKSKCLSTLKQPTEGCESAEESQLEVNSSSVGGKKIKAEHSSVPEELPASAIVASTATSFESIQSPVEFAEARNEATPIAAVVTQFASHPVVVAAAPPQSPSPVRTRTSSEDALLSTPEAKKESPRAHLVTMNPQMVRKSSAGRDDHESLNEFLVAELQAYCSRLLNRGPPKKGPSGASDLAQITALQLHQDHQRALMDFDDEWKRSHADSYRGYLRSGPEEVSALPLANISCNPFQQDATATKTADDWGTLVRQIKTSCSKSSHQGMEHLPQAWYYREGNEQLFASHKRGSNGVIVGGDDGQSERQQIGSFMAQTATIQNTPAFHVVVAANSDLVRWENALASRQQIQLYPYWGDKGDRQNLLQLLSNDYFSSRNMSAHVLLTSFEVFMEDISVLTSLQCQLSIIDIPGLGSEQVAAIWPHLLSLRCRQRLLFCQHEFEVDARKLLHFLAPELFGSRRKLLAWNCAAFHPEQIREICDIVQTFVVISNADATRAFIAQLERFTSEKSEHERVALGTLNRQGMVRAVEPSIKVPAKRFVKKTRNRATGHIPTKGKIPAQNVVNGAPDSQLPPIQSPKFAPKKRRGSARTSRSRKRISRCGKCAGCLADDCMVCGHCQDMKKYGGPGLRKQSCKNRKCLNPKSWGLATRKRKRSNGAKRVDEHNDPKDMGSAKDESEIEDDPDDATATYSSVESDKESESAAAYLNADGALSDSDGPESLRLSDRTIDSPRDLLLPASDTLVDDHLSLSDLSSRSARTRVMRCGECAGCRAPDCMKCRHCLDMKKYGGPGLRKQSCKDRKCIAPKIVMLNQAKDEQYVDEKGNVVYGNLHGDSFPGFYEAPDSSDKPETSAVVARASTATPSADDRSAMLSLIQECELFVEPRLVFVCKLCVARFSSKALLDFHKRVEHPLSMGEDGDAPTALEREASHLFMHPIYQNAIIGVQLKQQDRSQRSSPLGYAKLEGGDFQFFLIQPFAVLGRMSADWRELYNRLGIRDLKGLAGGQVDCHLGNDSMIDNTHAVISWDAHVGSFVIQCLSSRAPISVNGREVSFSSPPATLRSRNLLQIGASVFHFLLPKATEAGTQRGDRSGHSAARGERIPPAEVRVWMLAAVKKRRAARLAAETLDDATDLAVVAGEEQMKSSGEAQ